MKMKSTNDIVGNADAMRRALKEISRNIWESVDPFCNDECCKPNRELAKIADAALAKPPRNCDVGSADEQAKRYAAHCAKFPRCVGCPCCGKIHNNKCEFAWAQMPYKEGGAK